MRVISDVRFMHQVCAYVKYMQMFYICIYATYADASHMDMPYLYTVLFFSAEIRKKDRSGGL